MAETAKFEIVYLDNVKEFEKRMFYYAEQEMIRGKPGQWLTIADVYVRQLTIISIDPYPEEPYDENKNDDEITPSIKHITFNTDYDNFYRWGIPGGRTGNHRIIYAIHNYSKIIMLHYFDKQYNGLISRNDLLPAELKYEEYCLEDPSLY